MDNAGVQGRCDLLVVRWESVRPANEFLKHWHACFAKRTKFTSTHSVMDGDGFGCDLSSVYIDVCK